MRFTGLLSWNDASRYRRRPEHRELVRDLEAGRAEAVQLRGDRRRGRGALRARPLEHAAPQEDALEVRGGDVVPERGGIEVAELRDRERRRREREAEVVCTRASRAGGRDRRSRSLRGRTPWREGATDARRCPRARRGRGRTARARDTPSPVPSRAGCGGIAQRLQLLEVGELADVDLHGEVPADGLLERLSGSR